MTKRWLIPLTILVVAIIKLSSEQAPAPRVLVPIKNLKTIPTIKYPSIPQVPLPVSRVPSAEKKEEPAADKTDPSFEINIDEEPLRIGKAFSLVKDMATVPKEAFDSSMGVKLTENKHYVFFRPNSPNLGAWPVALNRGSKKLFPVSHILHVKGVDPVLRDQLKAEGMKEYYYHAGLKFISLEASPATVVKQFQELTAKGYKASLEVLKDPPQAK